MQSGIDPFSLMWIRLFCGAVFFTIMVQTLDKSKKPAFEKSDIIYLLLCGLFGSVLNQVFFYYGMKITNPINASIFNLLNPITIIALSYFLLKEKISPITLCGFTIALIGCLFLLDIHSFNMSDSTFLGDIFIVINALFFGTYIVLVSKLTPKFHPFVISKWMLIIGLVAVTKFSYGPLLQMQWSQITLDVWLAIGFIVVFNTIFAYWITNYLPQITSPYIMGMYVYAQPFVTSVIAVAMAQDVLTSQKIFCGIMIILGIYLAQHGRKQKSQ